jgi:hypothetical protein
MRLVLDLARFDQQGGIQRLTQEKQVTGFYKADSETRRQT